MYTETSGSKSNSDDPCECPGITTCSTTSRSMRWRTQSSPQPDEMSILLCPFQTESEHTGMRAEGYASPAQGYSVCSTPQGTYSGNLQMRYWFRDQKIGILGQTGPSIQWPTECSGRAVTSQNSRMLDENTDSQLLSKKQIGQLARIPTRPWQISTERSLPSGDAQLASVCSTTSFTMLRWV